MTQPRSELITSAKNPLLREVRRAAARGELTVDGFCVSESFHLLEEAIRSRCRIEVVLAAEGVRSTVETHVRGLRGTRVVTVTDKAFAEISNTEASQGVIALVEPPKWTLEQLLRSRAMVVLLDGVQDPGNAGTIIRSAEAFGATGALFLKGTVSPYNPKTLRASAGSLFRLPFVTGIDGTLARTALEQKRIEIYAAQPKGKLLLAEADLGRGFALVIGSEGRGVSEKLASGAVDLRIPTVGVESLNAATAATVILYEAARQRTRQ
ncbi:MAG: RNA methyltransferase [Bryobacterales bacterium]|nr:RNA methyltransferase [Bryobacterales bacterium]